MLIPPSPKHALALFLAGFFSLAAAGCAGGGSGGSSGNPSGGSGQGDPPPAPDPPARDPPPGDPPPPEPTYTVSFAWDAPFANEDGTALTDLAGYRIYDGTTSGVYEMVSDAGKVNAFTVRGLSRGTYYFAVAAYDAAGREGRLSNEVTVSVP